MSGDRVSVERTAMSRLIRGMGELLRQIPRNPAVLEVGQAVNALADSVKALDTSPARVLDKATARTNTRKRKKSGFDKTAYQRDYMRKKRAAARAAAQATPVATPQGKTNARKRGKAARG